MKKLIAVTAVLAAGLMAQPQPPTGGDRMRQLNFDSIKTFLNLSDTQLQSLQQLSTQNRDANRATLQEIATKSQALQQALTGANPDPAAIGRMTIEIQQLRKKVSDTNAGLTAQAMNVLTPDQKTKLASLEEARKLQDEIRQAGALHLLAPPERGERGPGPGGFRPGSPGGPGGFRPSGGPGGRFGRGR